LSIAIDEITAAGGVLGKKLQLVVRDDESNPAKGVVAARELVQREQVAALFGGLDTPVSIAIVPFANQSKVPFMGVWPPAPRSPATAPRKTMCSGCRPSMHWSTRRSSPTR
jgi:ABC-type branched-subunit amino acid transport system substrate-binding protein